MLLDDYEPLMRTAQVAALFDELKRELVPMIAAINDSAGVDASPVQVRFPVEGQRALSREIVELMGFTDRGWRLDDTVHPFATGVGDGDVRITTRYDENYWPMALFGSMHECGHGLYEEGSSLAHPRSPLGAVDSLAMHESQSRLWENMVGRGRAFATVLAPRVASHCEALEGIESDTPVPRRQPREAVVHPRRGRRGDVRAAHHPALRARAGADRGNAEGRRTPPRRGERGSRTTSALM